MKIVVLDGHPLTDKQSWAAGLAPIGQAEVYDHSTDAETLTRVRGATVLITNKTKISPAVVEQCPELKLVSVCATGFDCVDLDAVRRRGAAVSNVPEYGTDSVAQFVFALLLELSHHVALHGDAVRAGEWSRMTDFSFWKTPLVELAGKTMGIVGFGRIGRRVGELAAAFGMHVLAQDLFRNSPPAYPHFRWGEVDELFAQADVISLHCPLIASTAGLVNRERLRLVKPTAILINSARGGLVVEQDLADALNAGQLAAAALDVVSQEPIKLDNPLLNAKNCLITPHIAWATKEARARLLQATIDNIKNFLAGRPTNIVS